MTLRDEVGQLSWVAKRYSSPRRIRQQWGVTRTTTLPPLPKRRRQPGEVWGVGVVRDEADIIVPVITHLLDQGVDHVLVADNRSVDGTLALLGDLARRDSRVHVAQDAEPAHLQSEKVSWLANRAWRAGADWIVPFDADEFWFGLRGTVAETLRSSSAGIVHAAFHHMVPVEAAPADPVRADHLMDTVSSFPGKVAARAHPLLEIHPGNHAASRVGGETTGLAIAHAQYRGPAQIARKVRQGAASSRLTGHEMSWFAPHWTKGAQLDDAAIEDVWRTISSGRPDPRIEFAVRGEMVRVRPGEWNSWDPEGVLTAIDRRRGTDRLPDRPGEGE